MIKITGNAIELKQGDSGAVRFFFKDKQTDFPYILEKFDEDYTSIDNNIPQSAIKFVVRQDPSDSSKAAIERYYMLDKDVVEYNSKNDFPATGETGKIYVDKSTNLTYRWSGSTYIQVDENDIDFYRFKSNVILESNPDKGLPVGGFQTDTLYYEYVAGDFNGYIFFFYKGQVDNDHKITYDYINSSINIVFKTEDTKKLFYKTYYYEIAYIEGTNLGKDNETITLKHTLIESTPFVVTGALVK